MHPARPVIVKGEAVDPSKAMLHTVCTLLRRYNCDGLPAPIWCLATLLMRLELRCISVQAGVQRWSRRCGRLWWGFGGVAGGRGRPHHADLGPRNRLYGLLVVCSAGREGWWQSGHVVGAMSDNHRYCLPVAH